MLSSVLTLACIYVVLYSRSKPSWTAENQNYFREMPLRQFLSVCQYQLLFFSTYKGLNIDTFVLALACVHVEICRRSHAVFNLPFFLVLVVRVTILGVNYSRRTLATKNALCGSDCNVILSKIYAHAP